MKALTNLDAYQQERLSGSVADHIPASPTGIFTPTDVQFALDINGDGQDTNADLQTLISYVAAAGNGSFAPVPEPSGLLLLSVGSAVLLANRFRRKLKSTRPKLANLKNPRQFNVLRRSIIPASESN